MTEQTHCGCRHWIESVVADLWEETPERRVCTACHHNYHPNAPCEATRDDSEAVALVEEILLLTDERDDSVPLTDYLPDEWVERAVSLVHGHAEPTTDTHDAD